MFNVKICPNCEKLHPSTDITCENCGHQLLSLKEASGLTAAKLRKPRTSRKPHKPVEYVQLSHGRVMKKSTYDWINRKTDPLVTGMWLFLGFSLLVALTKGCN